MGSLLRHLPLLLTLLVPLGLLAWLGSKELSRLAEVPLSDLRAEADRFLRIEDVRVREGIQSKVNELMPEDIFAGIKMGNPTMTDISHHVAEGFILEAFFATENFELLAPAAPRSLPPSAPLSSLPPEYDNEERDLSLAELLIEYGDVEGAIERLQAYAAKSNNELSQRGRFWAHFRLAGLLPPGEIFEPQWVEYTAAQISADESLTVERTEDAAAVRLLSDLQLAAFKQPAEQLELLEEICLGYYRYLDWVADDVINWTVQDLSLKIPTEDEDFNQRVADALALNATRSAARRFAAAYVPRVQEELARDFAGGRVHTHRGVLYHVMSSERRSLLALREATEEERRRRVIPRETRRRHWVGLRLDLPALVASILSDNPTSGPANIALRVHDPEGIPLFDVATPGAPSDTPAPMQVLPGIAGLEFAAIPIVNLETMQDTARNRALLILILVFVAAGGAFLLIHSVRRETQLATMKVQLLSRVTHELKTPLSVIKMYGETLGMGRAGDQEQVSRFAGVISGEADRLTSMVERILDFSMMEAGTFSYDKERVDLGDLVLEITDDYLPHVEERGMALERDIDRDLAVDVDPRVFASALVNLLENALKYTPSSQSPEPLLVGLHRVNGSATLEVADRGIGIPPEERDKVFDDFYRATNSGEARGAGLGLSLVSHFAKSHGGSIEAEPRPQGGTVMRLSLPLAPGGENGDSPPVPSS